ncbi:MAG: polysaccharide deacetylase family protein [Acidobacteria bacterium]|nr:polysaccharide deacetylase family protein [Acidobacteriota bacterium]
MLSNRIKRIIAFLLDGVGVCRFGIWLQRRLYGGYVRAINYHAVAYDDGTNFEEQLKLFAGQFRSVSKTELGALIDNGEIMSGRPGLIVSFDDGDASHFEVAAPLLEKYGFTGWFFVPSKERGLTDEHLRELAERHVIGSHTRTHCRLNENVPIENMTEEISGSKTDLENVIGREVDVFAWVGGEEGSYSREAARLIHDNYRFSFMTNSAVITIKTDPYHLQRTNIEADQPLWLVRFQISGLLDVFYYFKRRRVNRLTA